MLLDIGSGRAGSSESKRPPSRGGRFGRSGAVQTRTSGAGVAARDAVDLEPGDAEVVELAIGELRQLAHRLAVGEIGADLREDHGHEHWRFPFLGPAAKAEGRGYAVI